MGLADGLAARADVELIAYLEADAVWPRHDDRIKLRRLQTRRPQLRIPFELPIRARRDRADLLHVQYVAPPIAGLPVVTAVHDVSFEDVPELLPILTRWRLQSAVRLAMRTSAVVVTPSEFSRGRLLRHYRLDPERVVVTPPGVAAALTINDRDAQRVRSASDLPPTFVLCVGDLQPRKNVPRLIAAIERAREAGVEIGLVLAGQRASGARAVDEAIGRHDASGWVRQLGYVDAQTLAVLYAEARVVAYVSLYEGFGLPLLEAMAHGTPVVGGNRSAIPEVAGDAALLVDPSDETAIADALGLAATDPATRQRLRAAGPARAARFSVAGLAAATLRAYRLAVGR